MMTRLDRGRLRPAVFVSVPTVCASLIIAIVLPEFSWRQITGSFGLILAIPSLLLVGAYFRRCRANALARASLEATQELATSDSGFLAAARNMYFGGMLTIGVLLVRPALGFTLSDWLFMLSLLFAMFHYFRIGGGLGWNHSTFIVLGCALYGVSASASSFHSNFPVQSLIAVAKVLYLLVGWFWLSQVVLRNRHDFETAVLLWVISCGLCGAGALLQQVFGNVIPGGQVSWGRSSGLTGHPNELGGVISIVIPAALTLLTSASISGFRRLICAVSTVFIGVGLVSSGSIGATAAAAAGVGLWFVVRKPELKFCMAAAGVSLLAWAALLSGVLPTKVSPFQRIPDVVNTSYQYSTLAQRENQYTIAWGHISSDPIIGVGSDSVSRRISTGDPVHNFFLGLWYEAGFAGLVGILIVLIAVIGSALSGIRRPRSADEWTYSVGMISSLLGFLVMGMSSPIVYQRYGWVPAALIVALVGLGEPRQGQERNAIRRARPRPGTARTAWKVT